MQHRQHFVPRLVHLAAINAFERQALEDHFVPIDGGFVGQDAKQRQLAAVVHRLDHVAQRARIARHLQPDVEALVHVDFRHHVAQGLLVGAHRPRRAHLPGERQAIVVDVGDDDLARAGVAAHGDRHQADRPGAGDQHVLAHEIERQRGMHGVAERIEDRRDLVGHRVRNEIGVRRGDGDVVGEGAGPVDADAFGVAAQMRAPGAAIAAEAAHDVPFARHPLADFQRVDVTPDRLDHPDIFMADDHRHGDRGLRPFVPIIDMQIRAADRRLPHFDQHVRRADFGSWRALAP